jgi:DNA-directed RNA polymerase subunit beta'
MSDEPLVAGEAFKAMLAHVKPSESITKLTAEAKLTKSVSKRNDIIKKIKYLHGLIENGMDAKTAFILHNVPVVPPEMRPTIIRGGNRLELADVNNLYRDHMIANNSLKKTIDYLLPEELINERKEAYEGVKAIVGLGEPISPNSRGRNITGLLRQIAGKGSPKAGLFHNKILSKKQDFSGRATIYAEPNLGFNEAAVPADMLWMLYKFHILRDLARQGYDYVNSTKAWETRSPAANNSFLRTIKRIPIIINRAPTLMKSNITAVFPVPITGSTMGLNPIHLPLFAGDYDGDALTIHTPMSPEAVEEARSKLLPQHQVHDYRRGLGQSIVAPAHEAILGSMHMTTPDHAQETVMFKTEGEALTALREGKINETTPIEIKQ